MWLRQFLQQKVKRLATQRDFPLRLLTLAQRNPPLVFRVIDRSIIKVLALTAVLPQGRGPSLLLHCLRAVKAINGCLPQTEGTLLDGRWDFEAVLVSNTAFDASPSEMKDTAC